MAPRGEVNHDVHFYKRVFKGWLLHMYFVVCHERFSSVNLTGEGEMKLDGELIGYINRFHEPKFRFFYHYTHAHTLPAVSRYGIGT